MLLHVGTTKFNLGKEGEGVSWNLSPQPHAVLMVGRIDSINTYYFTRETGTDTQYVSPPTHITVTHYGALYFYPIPEQLKFLDFGIN